MNCFFRVIGFLAAVFAASFSFGHGLNEHVAQMKAVFNGYNDKSFEDFYSQYSFNLDEQKRCNKGTLGDRIRKALEDAYGCDVLHGANHRIYGHKWVVGRSIPRDSIRQLEAVHSNAFEVVKPVWIQFCTEQYKEAGKLLGIVDNGGINHKVLHGFVVIVHSVHLLGDREPGNSLIDLVLPLDAIIKNIGDASGEMLKDEKQGKEIRNALKAAARSASGEKRKAKAVLDKLIELQMGTRLNKALGNIIARAGHTWQPPEGGAL